MNDISKEQEEDKASSRHYRELYETEAKRSQQLAMELSMINSRPFNAPQDGLVTNNCII